MPPRPHLPALRLAAASLAFSAAALGCSSSDAPAEPATGDPFTVTFPSDFVWGTASAAYQAEGTHAPGGATVPSNWQEWEALGKIKDGQTNADGAGFYERYDADFALAEQLGTHAYRLGVEWARIETAPGVFDADAIAHYRAVLASARAHGLEPIVTLYHWVVPLWVQSPKQHVDLVGQAPTSTTSNGKVVLHSAFSDAFVPFAAKMGEALGDLVDTWVVLNEPYSVISAGYLIGSHPNGKLFDLLGARNATLNFAIAYPAAYDALHASDTADADGDGVAVRAGNAMVGSAAVPSDPNSAADVGAAKRMGYFVNELLMNAWSSGALDVNVDGDTSDTDGPVPEGVYEAQLGHRLDYVGLNYYSVIRTRSCPGLASALSSQGAEAQAIAQNLGALPALGAPLGAPMSENGLEVVPEGFLQTMRVYDAYTHAASGRLPMWVLENGHGDCDDDQRPKYLAEHLYQLGLALREGMPLRGYMHWSLTDNFEWGDGRDQCFGLYKVDYAHDLARVATKSVPLYRAVTQAGAIDRALYDTYAAARYPTDCNSIADAAARQTCLDALPPSPLAKIQTLVDSLCKP